MEQAAASEGVGLERYRPSGRVSVALFLPLVLAAAGLAAVMGYVLLWAEADWYFYFVTPMFIGGPVFAGVWAAVEWSRCRSAWLGTATGGALLLFFYVGYWWQSYQVNVVAYGPGAVAIMEQVSGLRGLPGYVVFRARTSKPQSTPGPSNTRPPTVVDEVFNYAFFGGELLMLVGMGGGLGYYLSSRVYSERLGRWAKARTVGFAPGDFQVLAAAIEQGQWALLEALPKVPTEWPNRQHMVALLLKLECAGDDADEPVYATLTANKLGRVPEVKEAVRRLGGRRDTVVRQARVPAEQVAAIRSLLPSFDAASKSKKDELAEASDLAAVVAESESLLAAVPGADPLDADVSLCLRKPGPARKVWKSDYVLLPILLVQIGAFFGGLFLAAYAEDMVKGAGASAGLGEALMWVGGGTAIGAAVLLLYVIFGFNHARGRWLARRLRRDERSWVGRFPHLKRVLVQFKEASAYHRTDRGPDDLALCLLDVDERRLLVEGLNYRMVVRGADVRELSPLQTGEVVAVSLGFEAIGTRLDLVLYRESMKAHLEAQVPLVSTRRDAERLARRLAEPLAGAGVGKDALPGAVERV